MCPAISPAERIAKTKTSQAQADNSYESFDREHEHTSSNEFSKRDFYVNRAKTLWRRLTAYRIWQYLKYIISNICSNFKYNFNLYQETIPVTHLLGNRDSSYQTALYAFVFLAVLTQGPLIFLLPFLIVARIRIWYFLCLC